VIRRVLALFAILALVVGFVLADDPLPRLKKKSKPAEDAPTKKDEAASKAQDKEKKKEKAGQPPRLRENPKDEDDPGMLPPEEQVDEQEVLNRLAQNMRAAEDRLGNKELGESTQQVLRDILDDLDKLIRQTQNGGQQGQDDQQDQQNQGGAQQDQQKQGQQKQGQQQSGSIGQQKNQRGPKQSQRAQREARRMQKRSQQQSAQGQQQGGQQEQNTQQQADSQQGGGRRGQQGEPNKIADMYKDIWGHLPETMRAEMDAYGREKFMLKYEKLIRDYYDRAARESRRKED
jgi:hypothetical protein